MSHFAHAHRTTMPTYRACRISLNHAHHTTMPTHRVCRLWLMPIAQPCPPIEHVAFRSCPSHNYAHPSTVSPFAYAHHTIMPTHRETVSPFTHAHPATMPTDRMCHISNAHHATMPTHWVCRTCRILLMPITQPCPPIDCVAFRSCPSHNHAHPSSMSLF